MADRVSSDHDSVTTHRVTADTIGRTSRRRIELPDAVDLSADEVVRLTLDGSEYHARVETAVDGTPELHGAYDNARLAKAPEENEDRLAEWLDAHGVDAGRSLQLDVLVEGYHYGLREPGDRVVYTVTEPPSDSLSDIASDLGE